MSDELTHVVIGNLIGKANRTELQISILGGG